MRLRHLGLLALASSVAAAPRPNVRFIVADNLYAHVDVCGDKVVQTPHGMTLSLKPSSVVSEQTSRPIPCH